MPECEKCGKPCKTNIGLTLHLEKYCKSINEKDEENKKKNRRRKAKKKKRKDARDEPIMESCDFGDVEDELRGHSHNAPAQVKNIN